MKKEYKTFEEVVLNLPICHEIVRHKHGTAEDCVIALANHAEELFAKVVELEAIAPKKIRAVDGKVYVWRCPDDLIPEAP